MRRIIMLLIAMLPALAWAAEPGPRETIVVAVERMVGKIQSQRERLEQEPELARELVREEIEGLVNPEINFEQNLPQLDVTIDRERADDLGISVETVANTLQTMLASREVTTFVSRGREYPVIAQAEEEDRRTPSDIDNIFVRSGDGETLVPLGALVTVTENAAAPSLRRFDRPPSTQLSSPLAPGAALATVLTRLGADAAPILPAVPEIVYQGPS